MVKGTAGVGLTTGSHAGAPCVAVGLSQQEGRRASPGRALGSDPRVSCQAGKGLLGDSPSFVDLKGKPSVPRKYNHLPLKKKKVKALFLSLELCFQDADTCKILNRY